MAFFSVKNQSANGFSSDIECLNSALPEYLEMEMDGHGLVLAHYNVWDSMPEFDPLIITEMEENHGSEAIAHIPISNNVQFADVSALEADTPHDQKLKTKIHERQSSDFVEASANGSSKQDLVKRKKSRRHRNSSASIDRQENCHHAHNLRGSEEEKEKDIKDYVHLRARRGEATQSHSLAERVRREKIKERMERLQELVPGCCKLTGRARVLDEIINYVQSMQNQVQYLSAKLASVTPLCHLELDIDKSDHIKRQMQTGDARKAVTGEENEGLYSIPGEGNDTDHCFVPSQFRVRATGETWRWEHSPDSFCHEIKPLQ